MASIAAGMKRKGGGEDGSAAQLAPKRRLTKHMPFRESESIRERAKPYLLAVGKLHVDVMDTTWSTGRNRRVEPGYVRELTEVFMKGGLERGAPENRLFFIGSSGERMVVTLLPETIATATAKQTSSTGPLSTRPRWRSWRDSTGFAPSDSTSRQQARWSLMPGGRVSYTTKLPADLNIKLRVNRRDLSLPDNHGQIWNHLVLIASVAVGSITGSRVTIDHRLVEALRLGSEKSFPTRRLVTLWNHKGWREITTRWCQTRLGLETFNISTFEWIAGLRIDDYWFAMMRTMLATLEALPLDETQDLGLDDWSRLASGLQGGKETSGTPAGRTSTTQDVVEAIFFTGNGDRRVAGLLDTLDDAMYRAVCRAVWNRMDLHFADLKRLLCNRRLETEAAVRALQHVIGWVDRASAVELESVNPKLKNKPQLLEHLQDALDSLSSSRGDLSSFPANTARRLQQQVLDFARCNAKRAVNTQDRTHILRPAWETVNANEGCLREAQVSTLVSAFCSNLIRLSDQPIRKKDIVLLALQRRIEKRLPRLRTTSLSLKVLHANQQVAGNSKQQLRLKQQVPQKQH
ncbi:hypothetical protein RB213_015099 [Colletotrichum asianum]